MEFNDLFKLHVPDILTSIFLHLDPLDLETAYAVCPQWRDFIERWTLVANCDTYEAQTLFKYSEA